MKKTLTLCILLFAFCIFLTACGGNKCEHVYDNACDATCNECEETREVSAHQWKDADCDTAKTCSACGVTEGEALGHEMTTPDVDQCEVQSTCSRCGATEGQNKEHTWTDADCDTAKTCSTCGKTDGEALGHRWADADCDTAKTCSVCGKTDGEALGHKWTDADCDTAKTCSVCGKTDGEALGHKWTDADCDTAKTCSVCGKTDGEALGHRWTDADCDTAKTCSVCGKTDGEALGHKWTDADCDTAKTCSVCGKTDGEALGHKWTDADCDTAKTCSVCGATEGDALGHKWTDADCDTAKTCSACGKTEGEPLGHKPDADDGDCSTAIKCSACQTTLVEAKSHVLTYTDYIASGNKYVASGKCENCTTVFENAITIIMEIDGFALNELRGINGEPVFYGELPSGYYMYDVDTGEHQNTDIRSRFYVNESCADFLSSNVHTGNLEHKMYVSGGVIRIGFEVIPKTTDPITVTLSYDSVPHVPSEEDGDCTTPIICQDCGMTMIPANESHVPNEDDGDCTTAVTCKACGMVAIPANESHVPDTDDGDCTTAVYCIICDQIAIPAREGHSADVFLATCQSAAVCDRCGMSFGELDPDNHTSTATYAKSIDDEKHGIYHACCRVLINEVRHTANAPATCNQKASCTDCGIPFGALDPNNHATPETVVNWISAEYHEERYNCCDTVVKTEAHNGKASCMHVAYCTVCKMSYGDYDMTNHESNEFVYESNAPDAHTKLHACCRTVNVLTEACSGGTATCVSSKICDLCKKAYGEVDPANHASENYTYTDYSDGTHGKNCSECGITVASEAHTYVCEDNGDGTHTGTCACGNKVTEEHNVSSTTGACLECKAFLAVASITVGDVKTYYVTLDEAITYANGQDSTVIVIENDCSVVNYTRFTSGNTTVDLNGKTVNSITVEGATVVTVRDSVGGGKTLESVNGWEGTLIIEGGTHSGETGCPQDLVITGGEFARVSVTTGDNATVSGGSFEEIRIYHSVGKLADILAEGYCFYDKDGNVVDTSAMLTDVPGWYVLYDVTVGTVK